MEEALSITRAQSMGQVEAVALLLVADAQAPDGVDELREVRPQLSAVEDAPDRPQVRPQLRIEIECAGECFDRARLVAALQLLDHLPLAPALEHDPVAVAAQAFGVSGAVEYLAVRPIDDRLGGAPVDPRPRRSHGSVMS